MGGNDVACAVAFWGRGAEELLPSAQGQAPRVICNVTLGGTNPSTLQKLSSIHGDQLRHHVNLHAKVYISDKGLVVGSANASDNGIGLTGAKAALVEAGSFYEANTGPWRDALDWFNLAFASSPVVDEKAIAIASRTWMPPRTPGRGQAAVPGSLFSLVCAQPNAFSDIGFVFVDEVNDREVLEDLIAKEAQEGGQNGPGWALHSSFLNWGKDEVASWPAHFFEFWLKGTPRVYAYETIKTVLDDDEGHVLGAKRWDAMVKRLSSRDVRLPSQSSVANADLKLAKLLHGGESRVFRNGFELVDAINHLEKQSS